MGQIKNIKLHIVTDIKLFIENKERDEEATWYTADLLADSSCTWRACQQRRKVKEVKDVKKDEGITAVEEEKADDKDTSEDGVDDNEILDIELGDDGEEAEQNDPYVRRRYRRYRRRYRRSYYRNYWRRRWGKK